MNQERIGKFISKLRKDKKLTQEELAEQLHISSKSISRWETGKCMPDISLLIPLSEILDVSVNELILGEHINSENIKQKTEQTIKETIKYSSKKIQKEKKKNIWLVVFVLLIISIILGTIDYTRIKYGEDPIFMIRITKGDKQIHHYLGFGYRVERKVGVSYHQPFVNSEYVRFGPWIFTSNVDIITAEPDYIYIKASGQELRANRGSSCWTEKNLSKCIDKLGPIDMHYQESLTLKEKEKITVIHSYGIIANIKAYQAERKINEDEIVEITPKEIPIEYTENKIIAPTKEGTYYIVINIEAEEGQVWHSFKLNIEK